MHALRLHFVFNFNYCFTFIIHNQDKVNMCSKTRKSLLQNQKQLRLKNRIITKVIQKFQI